MIIEPGSFSSSSCLPVVGIVYYLIAVCCPSAALPNCSDEAEVKKFLMSEQYLALYSYYSNISDYNHSIPANISQCIENHDDKFSLDAEYILPKNNSYLKLIPPKICGKPAQADFHITVLSLDSIDESSMTFTLDMWLSIAWFDGRLQYPNCSDAYRVIDIQWASKIWMPDVVFSNARNVMFHKLVVPNNFLVFMRNNAFLYELKLTLELTCPMNLELYPHDLQVCDLKMESMTHRTRDLNFTWDIQRPVSLATENQKVETPQFTLLRYETISHCISAYSSGHFPCLSVKFYLKRRLGFHIIHSFLPSTMIVMLSWITFWIRPADIAARFGLGLTSLLTLATFNIKTQEQLPPVSYSKAIDTWMITCSFFVFLSVVEFAIVNYLTGRFPITNENLPAKKTIPPKGVRSRIRAYWNNRKIQLFAHNMDRVCRFSFPTGFVIFNIYYWRKHL